MTLNSLFMFKKWFFSKIKKYRNFVVFLIFIFLLPIVYSFVSKKIQSLSIDEYITEDIKLNGFYKNEPGGVWTNGNATILALQNKTAKQFSLIGFCPDNWPENRLMVTINNKESATVDMIPGSSYYLEVNFENTLNNIYISINTEKTLVPKNEGWNEDDRELGAYINAWALEDFYVLFQEKLYVIANGIKYNFILLQDNYFFPNTIYNGFYDDKWINGNASIVIINSTATHFLLEGYYPENMPDNSITVTINNKENITVDMTPGNPFSLELDFEDKPFIIIRINTEKTFIPKDEGWNEDGRELGALISSWLLSE